jgi:hypothetical protein
MINMQKRPGRARDKNLNHLDRSDDKLELIENFLEPAKVSGGYKVIKVHVEECDDMERCCTCHTRQN